MINVDIKRNYWFFLRYNIYKHKVNCLKKIEQLKHLSGALLKVFMFDIIT